ncbi:TonB family protein [Trinickia dinghuensis]|uniref:TonB family protein n=1 Tax=Trinickia dinghuensis TaxID=2291023 RepID=A0A3D8JQB8_9BURK|nr:TonB family protein [Trinickia dinghuensis]RDU95218.1 TonB family protein [Trinickia dinghuensis]
MTTVLSEQAARKAAAGRPMGFASQDTARRARFSLRHGMAVSLMLHAMALGAVWVVSHRVPAPVSANKLLMVELLGMVADRQTEAAQAGEHARPALPPASRPLTPRQPRRAELSKAARHVVPRSATNSPVKVEEVEEKEKPKEDDRRADTPQPQPQPEHQPRMNEASKASGAALEQQVSRTIEHEDVDPDVLRRYLLTLRKAIKSRLSYPPDAGGVTGTPVVTFKLRSDGGIEPGSLSIRRSSGYSVLDEEALRAVGAAAPFGPPPKAMTIALDMPFTQDKP